MKWTCKQALKLMREYKESKGCADCKLFFPYHVLEFDHMPGTKMTNLGTHGKRLTEAALRYEMALCDVVCRNCHAERTFRRLIQKRGPRNSARAEWR